MQGRIPKPPIDKFLNNILLNINGCIEWTSYCKGGSKKGDYGYMVNSGKKVYAHRYSFEINKGSIPKGMYIDHMCRNRKCVNPNHLRLVTPLQNSLENSNSVSRINHLKKVCIRGHPFDKENTYICKNGNRKGRQCRECIRIKTKLFQRKLRKNILLNKTK